MTIAPNQSAPPAIRALEAPAGPDVREISVKLARSVGWTMASAIALRGGPILVSMILARNLGGQEFGRWAIVYQTVVSFSLFANLGLAITATKHVAQHRSVDSCRASRGVSLILAAALITSLAAGILMGGGGQWLFADALHSSDLGGQVVFIAVALGCMNLSSTLAGILTGLESFRNAALVNLVHAVVSIPLFWAVSRAFGLPGVLMTFAATSLLACGLNAAFVCKGLEGAGIRLSWAKIWQERDALLHFAAPAALSSGIFAIAQWLPQAFLMQTPTGPVDMAAFAVADQFRMLVTFVPTIVGTTLLPVLTRSLAQRDAATQRTVLGINFLTCLGAGLAIATPMILLAEPILGVYGSSFPRQANVLRLMAAVGVLASLASFAGNVIASRSRMWTGAGFNFLWAVTLIASAWFLAPFDQATGVALAFLIAYVQHVLVQGLWLYFLFRRDSSEAPCPQ